MTSQEQPLTLEDNSPKLSPDYASSTKSTSPSPKINPESQTPEFLEKLNEYYRLKNSYESLYRDKKNSVLKNPSLNIKQKKTAILKIKRNCISCKRPVGSIFQSKDNFLYAICGDKSNPCSLNIKINRGLFVNINELIDVFQEGVDEKKMKIIESKLDLLFNFKTENQIITLFNSIKNELNNDLEAVLEYKTSLIDITDNIANKNLIESKTTIIYEKIDLIKDTMKQFNETGEIQFIKDILQIYSSELIPMIDSLKKLKYKYYTIEPKSTSNNEIFYHLLKKKYTLQNLLVAFENPSIDSFEIGEKIKTSSTIPDKEIDLTKLKSTIPQEKDEEKTTYRLEGNKLMFGEKIIANKMDFEANKDLLESQEQISPVMAHNKGYKFEMLYTRPSHPVLFAIDPENGNIYVVDVKPDNDVSPEDEEKPSPPKEEEDIIPKTPSGTPPQIQIQRAKTKDPQITPSPEMELVYDSEEEYNIGD